MGFETMFKALISNAYRPTEITQLLINTCDLKASRFTDSSTTIEWSEPILEKLGYIKREQLFCRYTPLYQERRKRYIPSNIYPI
jgi:hypothetical protein